MEKVLRPKALIAVFGMFVALAGAFAGGVAVAPGFWVFRDSLQRNRVSVNACPPPEGDLYDVHDFVRANEAAEAFLAEASRGARYGNVELRYFATPEPEGYILYHSTGNPRAPFPPELLDQVENVFRDALNGGP